MFGRDANALDKNKNRLSDDSKNEFSDGMETKRFIEQRNSKLDRFLREQLGTAATPYLFTTAGRRPYTQR